LSCKFPANKLLLTDRAKNGTMGQLDQDETKGLKRCDEVQLWSYNQIY
jgi:hypothetical protein